MGCLVTMASLLSLVTSHQGGSAGSLPCLSSCTSSTSSLLALQLPLPASLTQNRKENWHSASNDSDQLVHVSYCVFVSYAWHFGGKSSGVHPIGLLCVRHYLQMWSWHCHLPNLLCQIQQAVSFAMSICMIWRAWLSLVFQVVQTLLISIGDVVPSARPATGY